MPDEDVEQTEIVVRGIRFKSKPGSRTKAFVSDAGVRLMRHAGMWGAEVTIYKTVAVSVSPTHISSEHALSELDARLYSVSSRIHEINNESANGIRAHHKDEAARDRRLAELTDIIEKAGADHKAAFRQACLQLDYFPADTGAAS